MHTLTICLFIACLFPYLARVPVAIAMQKSKGGYDNNHPRAQQASLIGFGARALAAHKNEFESLIIFAASVVTAIALQRTSELIQNLAILYLSSRVIYNFAYLMNFSTFRSLIWSVGTVSSLGILWSCIP